MFMFFKKKLEKKYTYVTTSEGYFNLIIVVRLVKVKFTVGIRLDIFFLENHELQLGVQSSQVIRLDIIFIRKSNHELQLEV